jgi:predicted RNA-binding Zn-ribbon protein involved in translation (DUF1610 family)
VKISKEQLAEWERLARESASGFPSIMAAQDLATACVALIARVRELEAALANDQEPTERWTPNMTPFLALADESAAAEAEVVERIRELEAENARLRDAHVPTVLRCPECGDIHIDRDEWAARPHRTHQCQACKHEWRPYEVATVGVESWDSASSATLDTDNRRLRAALAEQWAEVVERIAAWLENQEPGMAHVMLPLAARVRAGAWKWWRGEGAKP